MTGHHRPHFTPTSSSKPAISFWRSRILAVSKQRELETILRARGIDTVLIGGIATNFCCDTTAREAHAREFKVLFLSDGTATIDLRDTLRGTIPADQVQRLTLAILAFGFAEVLSVTEACKKLPATRT